MNPDPRVSVVLTSYNYRRYLADSVQSVFRQTYGNLELIAVDDGSTDGSRETLESLCRDAPIPAKTLFKSNGGQGSAINDGCRAAQGDFVALLDSDDYWYPDKVATMVALAARHPDGGVYQHQLDTAHGKKRNSVMSADLFPLWKVWGRGTLNIADDHAAMCFSPFLPTSALVFRRAVLEKILPIPAAIKSCPDAFLTRTAVAHGPLYSTPETLGHWRDHGGNMTHQHDFGFKSFWLPVILPELNAYYQNAGIGFQVVYEPELRSRLSLGRLFGQGVPSRDGVEAAGALRETQSILQSGSYALEFEVAPTTERTLRIDCAINGDRAPTLEIHASNSEWQRVVCDPAWRLSRGPAAIWIAPSSLAYVRGIRLRAAEPSTRRSDAKGRLFRLVRKLRR